MRAEEFQCLFVLQHIDEDQRGSDKQEFIRSDVADV
jgi:hypothetical protein